MRVKEQVRGRYTHEANRLPVQVEGERVGALVIHPSLRFLLTWEVSHGTSGLSVVWALSKAEARWAARRLNRVLVSQRGLPEPMTIRALRAATGTATRLILDDVRRHRARKTFRRLRVTGGRCWWDRPVNPVFKAVV